MLFISFWNVSILRNECENEDTFQKCSKVKKVIVCKSIEKFVGWLNLYWIWRLTTNFKNLMYNFFLSFYWILNIKLRRRKFQEITTFSSLYSFLSDIQSSIARKIFCEMQHYPHLMLWNHFSWIYLQFIILLRLLFPFENVELEFQDKRLYTISCSIYYSCSIKYVVESCTMYYIFQSNLLCNNKYFLNILYNCYVRY